MPLSVPSSCIAESHQPDAGCMTTCTRARVTLWHDVAVTMSLDTTKLWDLKQSLRMHWVTDDPFVRR
jgi:hypothetical protein